MTASSTRVGRCATGLGLFATKPIKRRGYIATYRGVRIPTPEAERREARGARYMFTIDSRWSIDGSPRWNYDAILFGRRRLGPRCYRMVSG